MVEIKYFIEITPRSGAVFQHRAGNGLIAKFSKGKLNECKDLCRAYKKELPNAKISIMKERVTISEMQAF